MPHSWTLETYLILIITIKILKLNHSLCLISHSLKQIPHTASHACAVFTLMCIHCTCGQTIFLLWILSLWVCVYVMVHCSTAVQGPRYSPQQRLKAECIKFVLFMRTFSSCRYPHSVTTCTLLITSLALWWIFIYLFIYITCLVCHSEVFSTIPRLYFDNALRACVNLLRS